MKKNTTAILVGVVALIVGFLVGNVSAMSMNMWNWSMMNHSSMWNNSMGMNMDMSDPMQMTMADMGMMLEGKEWDELDKAFLEGMIPHHQWAIEMARTLVNAKNPELKELWVEIIEAQQAEIDQMNEWLFEWWYVTKD